MLPERDYIRLRHMVDASREARGYVRDRSREDLDTDTMLLRALVSCIEIIGEAASRVSPDCQQSLPDIPWKAITAMRNRLIHAYFNISRDVVWATVTQDLARLEANLTSVVGPVEPEP